MNGLDKILEKIISDAKEKANECEQRASEEIEELKAQAMEEIARMEAVYSSRAEKLSEELNVRAKSSSALEYRNILLQKKTDIIDKAFDKAASKILSMPQAKYVALISDALIYTVNERKRTVQELIALYGEEEADTACAYEVIFNKKDIDNKSAEKIFSKASKGVTGVKLVMPNTPCDIDGGFILKCNDIEINCSVDAMVSEARARCENKVISELF